MTFTLQGIEIVGGEALDDDLKHHAHNASTWLRDNAPNTDPKSPGQLIEAPYASLYAIHDGQTVGHIAANLQGELWSDFNGEEYGHFTINSVVVRPGMAGRGIGSVMLNAALGFVRSHTDHSDEPLLVSALVCPSSYSLFIGNGFEPIKNNTMFTGLENLPPYNEMDLISKYSLGKTIVANLFLQGAGVFCCQDDPGNSCAHLLQ